MDGLFEAAGTLRPVYQAVNWEATSLGPVSGWSRTLRAAVDVALHTRFPVTLLWGPDHVLLYNEAYVELIADKHPTALGAPAAQVFADIWDVIGPMLTSVRSTGRATWTPDLRLLMDRRGYLEECFFTFSYSAVPGADGQVEGIIDIAAETTAQVLSQRRLGLLATLTDALSRLEEPDHLVDLALSLLRNAPRDLPEVRILAAPPDAGAPPAEPSSWSIDRDVVVETVAGTSVATIRLPGGSADGTDAVLVARLSQHLPVDEGYLRFVRLVGAAVAQALTRARTRQAERRVANLERELAERLQRSLLTPPAGPGDVEVAVRYRPATERARLGGDWYDCFRQPDGCLAVVIGDVAGHDRQAAVAMAQLRNLLRGVAYGAQRLPAAVLSGLDAAMRGLGVDVFATAVLARLEQSAEQTDAGLRTLVWSNAGHPPPVLVAPDGTATLLGTPPQLLLGLRADADRSDHRVVLAPGSTVVFYTDGLIDRRRALLDDAFVDLVDALTGGPARSAEQICEDLLARYADSTEDDIALVVVRTPAAPG